MEWSKVCICGIRIKENTGQQNQPWTLEVGENTMEKEGPEDDNMKVQNKFILNSFLIYRNKILDQCFFFAEENIICKMSPFML